MAASFDRDALLDALDEVGRAAIAAKARLDIAVYGGSALMLASNFRFGTEDVDIAELGQPWVGVTVFVPTARYMLALKLKALRVSDFPKGSKDIDDVRNLLAVLGITEVDPAIEIFGEFFPRSGADADKQRFVLKHILSKGPSGNAPSYPGGSG